MEHPGEGNTKAGTVPPYLAYRTFTNYIDGLKANGAPPSRIDRSVLGAFSGGVQTQLISTLRYLAARGASGEFSARLTTEPDTRFHEALGNGRGGSASAKPILVYSTPEE